MTTAFSLTPLFRQSIGFDRFNDLFEAMTKTDDTSSTYPPHNIEKSGDDLYAITMAVAGFSENDLGIMVENERLTVTGRKEDKKEEGVEYLHRGIATRAFERSFRLADHMRVTGAEMKDGLLRIRLQRVIPEEAKPRTIPINGVNTAALEGKSSRPKAA